MQRKLSKHGNGRFMLETRMTTVRQIPSKGGCNQNNTNNQSSGSEVLQQQQTPQFQLKQDYKFSQMKEFIKNNKDQLILQTKQVHEKELMDHIRITDTLQEFDTLTVTTALVADTQKFFNLMSSIVGSNFLKVPYEIYWDEERNYFVTKAPFWFQPKTYNSLATWIIYYIERALWIQYNANVKGQFEGAYSASTIPVFIPPEGKTIRLKNELSAFWKEFHDKAKQDKTLMDDLEKELMERTYKEFQVQETTGFYPGISKLNGGLMAHPSLQENIHSSKQAMTVLQREQDPEKFLQNLCMISLDRVDIKEHIQMERILAEIIKERSTQLTFNSQSKEAKKLQKRKLKRKQKQQKLKEQKMQNGGNSIMINELKDLGEDKDEEPSNTPSNSKIEQPTH